MALAPCGSAFVALVVIVVVASKMDLSKIDKCSVFAASNGMYVPKKIHMASKC